MKIRIIVCFMLFLTSCNVVEEDFTCPRADIDNEVLKNSINDYLKLLMKDNEGKDVTIYFEMLGDTTSVLLINLPPDTTMTKINGALDIGKFKLYLTGVNPGSNLYTVNRNQQYKLTYKARNNDIGNLRHIEPLVWKLFFLRDSLVKHLY